MLPTLFSYKAGLVVLVGIVSAPVLQPVLMRTATAMVRVGRQVRKVADVATTELKAIAAEAAAESKGSRRLPGSPAA